MQFNDEKRLDRHSNTHTKKERKMEEGQIIVPLFIALAVGIFVGTRIWIMFRK